jgi:hypothetical protein
MNTSKLNGIKATGANTRYGARGVPDFVCRFVSKTIRKWQKLATPHKVATIKKASA